MEQQLTVDDSTLRVEAAGPLRQVPGGWMAPEGPVTVHHAFDSGVFYRHGWHSFSSTRWVGLGRPPASEEHAQPVSLVGGRHVGHGLGAVQADGGGVLLLAGLGLDTQVGADRARLVGRCGGAPAEWFLAYGPEAEVFGRGADHLVERFGSRRRSPGRVWCTWYSFWASIDEAVIDRVLDGLDGLAFDVFQVDDGWQRAVGDWHPNDAFPRGMEALAERIAGRGYRPGLWLAPFVARSNSRLFQERPELFLTHADGRPLVVGANWGGPFHGLDLARGDAQEFVHDTITRVRAWGFTYLKLDFIYGGALGGRRANGLTGEEAYRNGIEIIREAAGDAAYLHGCGAPIVPSLGVFDGVRIGPDVAVHWEIPSQPSTDHTFGEPATRHAISTSVNRLWLQRAIAIDPDVVFFRTRCTQLEARQRAYLQDLATVCGFVGTSDPPDWLQPDELLALADYLDEQPEVRRLGRYRFEIDGREVDFSPVVLDDREAVALELAAVGP